MISKNYVCERCGAPAVICHHKKWLNAINVNDPETALSFDNLEALCLSCHNAEHATETKPDRNQTAFDSNGNIYCVKDADSLEEFKQDKARLEELKKKLTKDK